MSRQSTDTAAFSQLLASAIGVLSPVAVQDLQAAGAHAH